MPVDPQIEPALAAIRESVPLDEVGVGAAREWMQQRPPRVFESESPAEIEDLEIAGPGSPLSLRIYRPLTAGPHPAVVFAHSGGWIMGDVAAGDPFCRRFACESGCAVISVEYRLAPEHPFPAPLDDLLAAVHWVDRSGASAGLDPASVAVAGESSGGALAASACLRLRDEGGPQPRLQLLVCPVIDPGMATPSWESLGSGYSPAASQMAWMWGLYAAQELSDPYAAPVAAEDLHGLPETIVVTAEYDPLRDEAELYAERLERAGVPVTATRCEGQIHAVFSYAAVVDRCRVALDETARRTGAVLGALPDGV